MYDIYVVSIEITLVFNHFDGENRKARISEEEEEEGVALMNSLCDRDSHFNEATS